MLVRSNRFVGLLTLGNRKKQSQCFIDRCTSRKGFCNVLIEQNYICPSSISLNILTSNTTCHAREIVFGAKFVNFLSLLYRRWRTAIGLTSSEIATSILVGFRAFLGFRYLPSPQTRIPFSYQEVACRSLFCDENLQHTEYRRTRYSNNIVLHYSNSSLNEVFYINSVDI
jgi:hypothetical protein